MPERDDRLAADLREYYERMAHQPAPDVTGRVMLAADRRGAWLRRWGAAGGGTLALAAVAAVAVLALANHPKPTGAVPAGSPSPSAMSSPSVTPESTPSPVPQPTAPVVAGGLPAHGFVPTDVTAISADQWWVLGYNGPSCAAASCTRILHTTDGGSSFTSIPTPPVAPAAAGSTREILRFADPVDGWLVSSVGAMWSTHDGGAHWDDTGQRSVADLAASGGSVYAVECSGGSCTVARSATAADGGWSLLPSSAGHGRLGHLNVNGPSVWASIYSSGGGLGSLVASADGGQHFVVEPLCNSALGQPDLYAASSTILWATCATGTQASIVRSLDGGQHFTSVGGPNGGIPNSASIAAISGTTAVIGAQALLRTTDGGQSYATVEGQPGWTVVGFTTSLDGFAFSSSSQLWRTDDAGAHWHAVQFP